MPAPGEATIVRLKREILSSVRRRSGSSPCLMCARHQHGPRPRRGNAPSSLVEV